MAQKCYINAQRRMKMWLPPTHIRRGSSVPLSSRLHRHFSGLSASVCALTLLTTGVDVAAQQPASSPVISPAANANLSYADLADLADKAKIVVRAEVKKAARLKPEQAGNVPAGWARFYIEAQTTSLLFGQSIGESVKYLADVKLTADGKSPKLRKAQVLLFANPVPGKPDSLQLVAPDAQVLADPVLDGRVRNLLTEMVSPDAAPLVTGIREAIYVPGNLTGEGETQIFLSTQHGDPVSISVIHRPDAPAKWGVSLSEIVDQAAAAPARDTLIWYRLACFLPRDLPRDAILTGTANERLRASEDYRLVMAQLGPCTRTRAK